MGMDVNYMNFRNVTAVFKHLWILMVVTSIALESNAASPKTHDPAVLRRRLLVDFPSGSTYGQVLTKLQAHGIRPIESPDAGFLKQEPRKPATVVGKKSISANLAAMV